MTSLAIPPPYRTPLVALARLDDETAATLASLLEKLPAYAPVSDIQRAIGEVVGDDAGGLAASLLSLRGLLRTLNADEIGTSLADSRDLELDGDERRRLGERVSVLLKTAALSTTAVAVDLQTQHARNYQAARIFTDLRPVFPDDVDTGPTGAVIIETLQFQTWNRDGVSETIFIALDEKDLLELRGVVDRAQTKTAALRKFMDEKGLAYFQLEEEDE